MAKNREVHVANYNVALSCVFAIREIKFDVTWSYVKRQTAKMTSEFLFFSSNPSLNHIKIENCLLLFATNTNIFTLLFKDLKTDVRPRNVKLNLSICSLITAVNKSFSR